MLIGAAFEVLSIPVGAFFSSEYRRAWLTAKIALGHHLKLGALNFEPAEKYAASQLAAMRDRLTPLLTAMPPAGTNTVIVGHDDPFAVVTGIHPEPMGVAQIIRPQPDGSFSVPGEIPPAAWPALMPPFR